MSQPQREPAKRTQALHVPVLVREVIQYLDLRQGLTVVDGTVGGGGHSRKILESIGQTGTLIGLDRDPMMLQLAAAGLPPEAVRPSRPANQPSRLAGPAATVAGSNRFHQPPAADRPSRFAGLTRPNCHLHQASYSELPDVLQQLGIAGVDRILLDLGLSSDQLADAGRGFSFSAEGPLDLRFDTTRGKPAWKMMDRLAKEQLAEIFRTYGEEKYSDEIAEALVRRRESGHPVRTSQQLVEAVEQAVPAKARRTARKQPATRVFQALRIAVNEELAHLETALNGPLYNSLSPGGRLVVITFHSLEDRLVKQAFRVEERWQNLTRSPVTASPAEQRINPRSRTAKLRAAIKK